MTNAIPCAIFLGSGFDTVFLIAVIKVLYSELIMMTQKKENFMLSMARFHRQNLWVNREIDVAISEASESYSELVAHVQEMIAADCCFHLKYKKMIFIMK